MILRYLLLAIIGFSIFTGQAVLGAEPISDQQQIQHLIEQVGKAPIIEVIMEKRHGGITISRGADFEDSFGRPNKDYISAQTVAEDLKKLDMDVSALESELGVHISKKEQQNERLSRVQDDIPSQEQTASKDGAEAQTDCVGGAIGVKYTEKERKAWSDCTRSIAEKSFKTPQDQFQVTDDPLKIIREAGKADPSKVEKKAFDYNRSAQEAQKRLREMRLREQQR